MFEKLFIDSAEKIKIKNIDIESELNKLLILSPNNEFGRIFDVEDIKNKLLTFTHEAQKESNTDALDDINSNNDDSDDDAGDNHFTTEVHESLNTNQ